jgi:1-acyl-sn-glycerol-3-phosphate acyltransferase
MYTFLIDSILQLLNIEVDVIQKCNRIHTVIVSNHVSEIDPVIILSVLKNYNIRFIAGPVAKQNPLFNLICQWFNVIFIEQDKELAFQELTTKINQDDVVFIFPEGTLFFKSSVERSNVYCKKVGIRKFNRVLAPREAGFTKIQELLKQTKYTDITLLYDIDTRNSDKPLTITELLTTQRKKIKIIIDESSLPITETFRKKDHLVRKHKNNIG